MSATEAKERRRHKALHTACSLFNLHRVQVRRPSMVSVVLKETVRRGSLLVEFEFEVQMQRILADASTVLTELV
jgi:hypothetical protein